MPDEVDVLTQYVLDRLTPQLAELVKRAVATTPNRGPRLELADVIGCDEGTGLVTVQTDTQRRSGATSIVPSAGLLPRRGERVLVVYWRPAGAYVMGRSRGLPARLGVPAVATSLASGIGADALGLTVVASVQSERVLRFSALVPSVSNPSTTLVAQLYVAEGVATVATLARDTFRTGDDRSLGGSCVVVAPPAALHVYELWLATSTGTVDADADVPGSVLGAATFTVEDLGSATL